MKRFMANARLQNKTFSLFEAGNLSLKDLRSAEDQRLSFMIFFFLLTDFLIHNQCVALQISVNFNISSFFMW